MEFQDTVLATLLNECLSWLKYVSLNEHLTFSLIYEDDACVILGPNLKISLSCQWRQDGSASVEINSVFDHRQLVYDDLSAKELSRDLELFFTFLLTHKAKTVDFNKKQATDFYNKMVGKNQDAQNKSTL